MNLKTVSKVWARGRLELATLLVSGIRGLYSYTILYNLYPFLKKSNLDNIRNTASKNKVSSTKDNVKSLAKSYHLLMERGKGSSGLAISILQKSVPMK